MARIFGAKNSLNALCVVFVEKFAYLVVAGCASMLDAFSKFMARFHRVVEAVLI